MENETPFGMQNRPGVLLAERICYLSSRLDDYYAD